MVLQAGVVGELFGLGIVMGITHVLSGPDHLSALATLSVGGSKKAFWLGIRWGIGHSSGLWIVAIIFLSLKNGAVSLDSLGNFFDYFVGVFMIALGVYSLRTVVKKYKIYHLELEQNKIKDAQGETNVVDVVDDRREYELKNLETEHNTSSREISENGDIEMKQFNPPGNIVSDSNTKDSIPLIQTQSTGFCPCKVNFHKLCQHDLKNPTVQRFVAFFIGVVHGIAGPGGILGVLPAIKMHNWGKSLIYLGTFCFVSTLIMGIFAALYGEITARAASTKKIEFRLAVISSVFSIVVGVLWIILGILGKLNAIFG